MKKLAIVTSHPIQYNAPLFKLLTERKKIDVKVFYTWGNSSMVEKFDPDFGRMISWDIPLMEGYDYEFLENVAKEKGSHHFRGIVNPDIVQRIDGYDPDAVLVFGWAFSSHLKVLRHYHKKKTILFRGDSTLIDRANSIKERAKLLLLKWVYLHVDYALYVGKNNADYYKEAGLSDKQLIRVPHAIDNNRFTGNAESNQLKAEAIRKSLGIDTDKIVFLFAGKLEEKKDPALLLKAFAKSGLDEKAHLVIVGNGKLELELKKEFKQTPSIHFLDFKNQSEMPAIYRVSDVFVLPSKGPGETWGLAVNEAMASGRPVIESDKCGSAIDLVDPGENGLIFNAGNLEDLVNKIKMMAGKQKQQLSEMGLKAEKKISQFSFEKICDAIEMIMTKNSLATT